MSISHIFPFVTKSQEKNSPPTYEFVEQLFIDNCRVIIENPNKNIFITSIIALTCGDGCTVRYEEGVIHFD